MRFADWVVGPLIKIKDLSHAPASPWFSAGARACGDPPRGDTTSPESGHNRAPAQQRAGLHLVAGDQKADLHHTVIEHALP